MKKALKQAKKIREAQLALYTARNTHENLTNAFIGQQFDYTEPLYREIMKIKGMERETEDGFLTVFSKPRKTSDGIKLKITTTQSIAQPSESFKIKYHYNDSIKVSIKVSRNVGYKHFIRTINKIREVVDKYIDKKIGGKK